MKLLHTLLTLALLLSPATAYPWPGKVLHVTDGDTITVAPAGQEDAPVLVRFYGIDAPEYKQAYGKKATKVLRGLLPKGTAVEIIPMDKDTYGRVVGLVVADGLSVNHELIKLGAAWAYPKFCRAKFCKQWLRDAKAAKKQGLGLWNADEKEAIAPWEWRHTHHKSRNTAIGN